MRICLTFTTIICNEWFMLHSTEPVTANDVKSEILLNNRFITIERSPLNHGELYIEMVLSMKKIYLTTIGPSVVTPKC